jgi:hypothetical protein
MKRSKKLILVAVIAVVVLAGTFGGVALAQTGDEDNNQPETKCGPLLEKVCEIYNSENPEAPIDCEALKDAFAKAGSEIQAENRERMRQKLIDEDIMTEEQLDELEAWLKSRPEFPTDEFKEWMESRPDFPTDEYKEWMQSRPDDIPFQFGPRFKGGHRGFGVFGGGLRGWLAPDATVE